MVLTRFLFSFCLLSVCLSCIAQLKTKDDSKPARHLHYRPEGNDFVLVKGQRKFNRALYGTNTGFRVETGDLPEFALYMPGMGGNCKIGIVYNGRSKWITEASDIKTVYRAGSMIYTIKDPLLNGGSIQLTVLAMADAEGMIWKAEGNNLNGVELIIAYGAASGKKFSRDGDIGADPESSFYMQADYCKDNIYRINKNSFDLLYGFGKVLSEEERYEVQHIPGRLNDTSSKQSSKRLTAILPTGAELHTSDATQQSSPLELWSAKADKAPVLVAKTNINNAVPIYFSIVNPAKVIVENYEALATEFDKAESARKKIAERVVISTPDPYLNTLGGALSIAADAIWESPSYMHGAIAWRMRLPAWRGAYVADVLGWHNRAREHFSSYALSQVTTIPAGPVVADTALHLARQLEKMGTSMFSDGYICRNPNGDIRPHHYDMNLVFVDQLLNHFKWTGDKEYVKKMWPLLKKHLAWEKRNFDADDDGLYDAYCCIWASDALQYSGGGVTHSSAYNYRAFKAAAELAVVVGEDGTAYKKEADKIFAAIEKYLWLPKQGWYAEYKDKLGKQLVHPSPGLWTIYHAIDAGVANPFKAYQTTQYIDQYIPHIPVVAEGWTEKNMFVLSTSNWQPYTWSINNVALAENLHTALAYWQANRAREGFQLWRNALLESMYLSAGPGNFQQLSYYDAIRGELYRDFADPVGMAARTLVEGMFGIQPDLLNGMLTVKPGYPLTWDSASIHTPDIDYVFSRKSNTDNYRIVSRLGKVLKLSLRLPPLLNDVASVTVNGKPIKWAINANAVNTPELVIETDADTRYDITIEWKGERFQFIDGSRVKASDIPGVPFGQTSQGSFKWWIPVAESHHEKKPPLKPAPVINGKTVFERISLAKFFNDKLTNIFKQQYLSPRPAVPTLQLPTQGIGNWCYPVTMASIDDAGLRKLAAGKNEILTPGNIPFVTPADSTEKNILFTSQWDNYPKSATVTLSGNASHAFLLMAGSTNPMQSRMSNGAVIIEYTDNSTDTLLLKNPENWWPIEQDYLIDGYAFTTDAPVPERLYLKDGKFGKGLMNYTTIKGFSTRAIDGGAATVLEMPLQSSKKLQSLRLEAWANDVVIGLMAVTLVK